MINLFQIADYYERAEVRDWRGADGKKLVLRNEKGDYAEVMLFAENREWRFMLDNFPFQRKFFASNIPINTIEEFESDLNRMGIPLPKRKN